MKGRLLWIVVGVATVLVSVTVTALVATRLGARPGAAAEAAAGGGAELGPLVVLPRFITNLADPGTAVDVTFAIAAVDSAAVARVEAAKTALRDPILGVVRNQRAVDLVGAGGKDRLVGLVRQAVEEQLGPGVVQRVLVVDLVTQP